MLIALFRWWRHVFLTVRDAQERHVFKRIRRRWFGGRRNWRDWDDATEKSARISDVRNCDVSSVSVLRLGWNDLSQLFRRFFRQRRSFKFVVLKIIRIQIKNTIGSRYQAKASARFRVRFTVLVYSLSGQNDQLLKSQVMRPLCT